MTTKRLLKEEVSVAEAIVRVLEEAGIDLVFGLPGGNMRKYLFDALYDHQTSIRTVLVRHESLAGVMAEVYGCLTGKPGVAIAQGAFMLANGLLGAVVAHLGCSPMLLLCDLSDGAPFSHHGNYQSGTGEHGTWDAKQSFAGVTKATMVPNEAMQAVQSTQLAIKHALAGERGPVAVVYHSSALKGRVGPESRPFLYPTQRYLPPKCQASDEKSVAAAARVLLEAKRPVIIAGNGVRMAEAYSELQSFAELLGVPVCTTGSGKGVFPENHDLAAGVLGTFGLPAANAFAENADVVLVVGSKLSSTDTIGEHPRLLDPQRQTFIQIDIEPKNASWTFPCDHVLLGDAAIVLDHLALAARKIGLPSPEMLAERKKVVLQERTRYGFFNIPEFESNEVPIIPQRVIAELRKAAADDVFIACDAGATPTYVRTFFQIRQAGTFISPSSVGAVGYGIPAALAAKLIYPKRQVIAMCGDGGFAMSLPGLITAYEEKIPIVVVVFNNSSFGFVQHNQGDRVIASRFANIDYAAMARGLGCRGIRIEKPDHLEGAFHEALSSNEPSVLDVVTSLKYSVQDIASPLIDYFAVLKSALARAIEPRK